MTVPPEPQGLHRKWLRRKGEGDPLVMVHGFGGDHNSWRMLVAAAGLSRPVLAIDLPGHGKSPAHATTFEPMVLAVAEAIASEGVTTADLVGHSLGAAVAAGIAETGLVAVRSLFLLAPAGLGPEINGEFLAGFCRAHDEATLAHWMSMLVAEPASLPPVFVQVTAEARAQPGVTEGQRALAEGVFPDGRQAFSIRPILERSTLPIRIMFGAADRIIPPQHRAGLPGMIAQHVFDGIGHMPQIEALQPVAGLLVQHLRAVGGLGG